VMCITNVLRITKIIPRHARKCPQFVSPPCYTCYITTTRKGYKMTTYDRILKEQEEKRIAQRERDRAKIEAMYSSNSRPLNNAYLLEQHEG
jgi:hypothetical protein